MEDSSDPDKVYVWAFVQPLYAPATTVAFDLGKRLGGPSKTWEATDPDAIAAAVRDEGRPFFGPVDTPEALARWRFLEGRTDPHAVEARAFSLVASGRFAEGARTLYKLAVSLTDSSAPWAQELRNRVQRLANLVEMDPDGAQRLLAQWEEETTVALGIQNGS